jgi:hypothetical protein
MRESWSINRLATELRVDRRTVGRHIDLAGVKSSGAGPKGPTFALADVARALADAGIFESRSERERDTRHMSGRESGGRELAERVLYALAKRLEPGALRIVCEVIVAELHRHIGHVYGHEHDPENFHGAPLDWPSLTDLELDAALRSLIEEGYVPGGEGGA